MTEWPEYRVANPGFAFLYQLVDVGDLNGVGESEPTPVSAYGTTSGVEEFSTYATGGCNGAPIASSWLTAARFTHRYKRSINPNIPSLGFHSVSGA